MAYSSERKKSVFNSIIEDIEKGRALRTILKSSDTPSSQTFYLWLDEDESKSKRYARACEIRAEAIFEDILDISDNNTYDIITNDEVERTNNDVIQRSRLMVDARKWYLSKLNPKRYGDKIETTLQGGDKPIQTIDYSKISTEALKEIADAQKIDEAKH
tara:strand:+ start:244 stop:720 length:477 start_codon:yes stop_codon:yes gene_type:complete